MAINLDAARSARRETEKRKPELVYGGKKFNLPYELPIDTMVAVNRLQKAMESPDGEDVAPAFRDVAVTLLGQRAQDFLDMQPSIQDLSALLDGLAKEYGFAPEEDAEESEGADQA